MTSGFEEYLTNAFQHPHKSRPALRLGLRSGFCSLPRLRDVNAQAWIKTMSWGTKSPVHIYAEAHNPRAKLRDPVALRAAFVILTRRNERFLRRFLACPRMLAFATEQFTKGLVITWFMLGCTLKNRNSFLILLGVYTNESFFSKPSRLNV